MKHGCGEDSFHSVVHPDEHDTNTHRVATHAVRCAQAEEQRQSGRHTADAERDHPTACMEAVESKLSPAAIVVSR